MGTREQDTHLLFDCASYLALEDIARLANVDQALHTSVRNCPSVWKQCIRTCGISPSIRCSVWLSILYGKTPWRSEATAPHHLDAAETRTKIYEQLLVKVGSRMASGSLDETDRDSISEERQQLLSWLREIDADVTRTCAKDIYASDVVRSRAYHHLCTHTECLTSVVLPQADDWTAGLGISKPISETDTSVDPKSHQPAETKLDSVSSPVSLLKSLKSPTASSQLDARRSPSSKSALEATTRRVLRAYAMYNPRVGYCQGMSFLVRVLLEVTDNEADVFWLFVGLSEPEINRNLYEPGLAMLQVLVAEFELLVSYHMPELHVHFKKEGVHVGAFSTRWFMTLFTSFETFGPTMVLRVLDLFVIDGWRVLLSMGLVVLDELRDSLLAAELEGILRILQSPRRYMVEPDQSRRRQLVRHALAFCVTRAINTL